MSWSLVRRFAVSVLFAACAAAAYPALAAFLAAHPQVSRYPDYFLSLVNENGWSEPLPADLQLSREAITSQRIFMQNLSIAAVVGTIAFAVVWPARGVARQDRRRGRRDSDDARFSRHQSRRLLRCLSWMCPSSCPGRLPPPLVSERPWSAWPSACRPWPTCSPNPGAGSAVRRLPPSRPGRIGRLPARISLLMDNRRNYYRILHVQPDAPTEIIRMSYLTLMQRLKMHPDLGGDHQHAVVINEAFATLVDPEKRAVYDRTLARERSIPGYRSDPAHHGDQERPVPPAGPADPNTCAFCGTSFAPRELTRPDALCSFCSSPLYPAERHEHEAATRRALARVARRLPVVFYLSWPQHPGFDAMTEDISISGMRLTCAVDLVPNERLKLDCDLCSAVAVVRHAHRAASGEALWEIGVEFLTLLVRPARGVLVSERA